MRYFREDELSSLVDIRRKIQFLYKSNPNVHVNINVRLPRTPRQTLTDLPVVIKGVYPNVFQIEDTSSGKPKLYMHQYNEIATKEIEILELASLT
jgi:uncharacterized protein Veg